MSFSKKLDALREKGRFRTFTEVTPLAGSRVLVNNQRFFNLSSNDYLGIATNRELHERFYSELDSKEKDQFLTNYGLGASSSRLLSGSVEAAHKLESDLKLAYGGEAALLFNSGYHLNIGVLPALMQKGDLILSDKLNHASIHDGFRLSRAKTIRFNHKDYHQLRSILTRKRDNYNQVIIVTESVFSMDGDVADLVLLTELKTEFDCLLYVDEAHSVGIYGENGLGKCEEYGLLKAIDILVGTFGKAYGSVGAFVICTEEIKDYLINSSRSLIFTTALPPINYRWSGFIFNHVKTLRDDRLHLNKLGEKLREALTAQNIKTAGSSNIVPVIVGEDNKAVLASNQLREFGYLVMPVRPPAVPEGTSRLRISLTSIIQEQELEDFVVKLLQVI